MSLLTSNNKYGQVIPNLILHGQSAPYPVVNDRAIRANAGLKLVLAMTVFFFAILNNNYQGFNLLAPLFFIDFALITLIGPNKSILGWIGRFLVKKEKPEWVGAIQKRFAWSLGLVFSFLMLVLVLLKITGWPLLAICFTCMVLMWLESAAGICLGCKIYSLFVRKGWFKEAGIHPECPGGVCET